MAAILYRPQCVGLNLVLLIRTPAVIPNPSPIIIASMQTP